MSSSLHPVDEQQPLLASNPVEAAAALESNGYYHTVRKSSSSASTTAPDDDALVLPETATTGRLIGRASAYILILSRVVGSGIFAMPGTILQNVGSPGLALTLWVVGAGVAYMALVIDIEFGCMLPRSGGMKVYLEYAFPRPRLLAGTVVAVYVVFLGFTATNCVVFARYVLYAAGVRDAGDLAVKGLAVTLMTAVTVAHGVAYRTGVFVQNVLGWLKIGLVLFMVLTGFFVVFVRAAEQTEVVVPEERLASVAGLFDGSDWAWNTLATAIFKIGYSYAGLNNVNNVLNEVRDPVRVLKTIPPLALVTACLLYVLINVAYFAVVPLDEIKASKELVAALFFDKVFGQGFGNRILPVAIALSAAGNVMVVTFSMARINQEVARSGLIPYSSILSSSQPFGSPLGGLIVHYIPSVLVIAIPPSQSVYAFIAEVEGYAGQFLALALGIGLLLLRQNKPDLLRPFRAWTSIVVLRVTLCVALISAPFFPPGKDKLFEGGIFYASYALVGIAVLFFSILYWYIWTRLWPRWRGYTLQERKDVLADGTTITRLVHVPQ